MELHYHPHHEAELGYIGIPFLKGIVRVLSFVEMQRMGRECLAKTMMSV
jgi:hypothetical protein